MSRHVLVRLTLCSPIIIELIWTKFEVLFPRVWRPRSFNFNQNTHPLVWLQVPLILVLMGSSPAFTFFLLFFSIHSFLRGKPSANQPRGTRRHLFYTELLWIIGENWRYRILVLLMECYNPSTSLPTSL